MLTLVQRRNLTDLYDAFRKKRFTVEECARVIRVSGATAAFHLKNFSERGLLEEHRRSGRAFYYSFKVNPNANPECFAQAERPGQISRNAMSNAILGGLAAAAG